MRWKKWWIGTAGLSALVLLSVPAGGHRGHRSVRADFADNMAIKSDGLSVYCGLETFDYTDQYDPGCSGLNVGQVTSHSHHNDDWDFRTVPDSTASTPRRVRLDFSGADPCPSLPTDVFAPIIGPPTCQFGAQVWFAGNGRIFYLPTTQIPFELLILKYVGFWKSVYVLVSDGGGVTVSHSGADNAMLANVDTSNCPAILYQLADKGAAKKIQPPVAMLKMCFSIALVRDGPTTQ